MNKETHRIHKLGLREMKTPSGTMLIQRGWIIEKLKEGQWVHFGAFPSEEAEELYYKLTSAP